MKMQLRYGVVGLLVLGCVLVVAPVVRAQDDAAKLLPGLEKEMWTAWSKADPAPFQKYLAENAVNINANGVDIGKAKMLASLAKSDCKVASFSLGDIQVTRVSDSTAVLTYTATQDATCQGTKMPAKVSASSVWVKQGGQWLAAVYHESPAGK